MFVRNFLFTLIIAALAGCAAVPADKDATSPDGAGISTESLGAADTATGPRSLEWCELAQGELSGTRPYQLWAFDGACDDVFIDLASRAGDDMFLILYARSSGGAWEIIDWNDDCYAGTLNSCLEVSTDADLEYLVAATTYEYMAWGYPASASYDLNLSCRGAAGTCSPPSDDATDQFCGGLAGILCPDGFYCAYAPEAHCGYADAGGTCQRRPDACIQLYDPVCGCDGNTYGNACMAANAGVSVASSGECEPPPPPPGQGEGETCGGIAALQCAAGLICDYSASGCWADAAGVCVVDEQKFCTREYAPVCGCDGVTYSNDCERRANYVGLDHAGAC